MGSKFTWLVEKFLDKKLDFRVRLFNVLAMAGTIICFIMSMMSLFSDSNILNAFLNLFAGGVSFALLYYSYRTGKYQRCYMITIAGIFLIMFPVLFFNSGGYHSGMISFFIFAILFTVFMLEGKKMVVMVVMELIVYTFLCVLAYIYPEQISSYSEEKYIFLDILSSFLTVSIVLAVTLSVHFRMYNLQQKELEDIRKKLIEENVALEQINKLKTEFLGNISHELKTPLTVVSGYAQITKQLVSMPEEFDKEEVIHRMKLITSEAERLALMVGQILDVTRIEEGYMIIKQKPCYLDEIIHRGIEAHYSILNKNGNELLLLIEHSLPQVNADAVRVSQVIVNLISNALKFTVNGKIIIEAKEEEEGSILICVSDTGKGISSEKLPFIFDRYNNKKSANEKNTGTGLGLFICKYIITRHGGKIWVESMEGKGTKVYFTLPVVCD